MGCPLISSGHRRLIAGWRCHEFGTDGIGDRDVHEALDQRAISGIERPARDIKRRLAPGGVYVLQASTAGFHNMALHAKMARSLRSHYRFVRSFYAHVPAFDNDWAFLACSDALDVAALPPERIDAYVAGLRNFEGVAGRYDFVKYPQRGISEDSEYIGRWDGTKNAWIGVSKAGGTPL